VFEPNEKWNMEKAFAVKAKSISLKIFCIPFHQEREQTNL
jgi:hypothetical protein